MPLDLVPKLLMSVLPIIIMDNVCLSNIDSSLGIGRQVIIQDLFGYETLAWIYLNFGENPHLLCSINLQQFKKHAQYDL